MAKFNAEHIKNSNYDYWKVSNTENKDYFHVAFVPGSVYFANKRHEDIDPESNLAKSLLAAVERARNPKKKAPAA